MKRFYSIILIPILFSCYKQPEVNYFDVENDLSKSGLNGKVKSVFEKEYTVTEKNDSIQIKQLFQKYFYEFNSDGNYIETNIFFTDDGDEVHFKFHYLDGQIHKKESYASDSILYRIYNYAYDSIRLLKEIRIIETPNYHIQTKSFLYNMKREVIKENLLSSNGDSLFIKNFKYDSLKNLVETEYINLENKNYRKEIRKYDGEKNIIEENRYSENDQLEYKFLYKYDSDNRLIEEKDFPQGDIFSKSTFFDRTVFNYDSSNNVVEKNIFDANGKVDVKWTYKYEYDYHQNWIKKYEANNKFGVITYTERQIVYFD